MYMDISYLFFLFPFSVYRHNTKWKKIIFYFWSWQHPQHLSNQVCPAIVGTMEGDDRENLLICRQLLCVASAVGWLPVCGALVRPEHILAASQKMWMPCHAQAQVPAPTTGSALCAPLVALISYACLQNAPLPRLPYIQLYITIQISSYILYTYIYILYEEKKRKQGACNFILMQFHFMLGFHLAAVSVWRLMRLQVTFRWQVLWGSFSTINRIYLQVLEKAFQCTWRQLAKGNASCSLVH